MCSITFLHGNNDIISIDTVFPMTWRHCQAIASSHRAIPSMLYTIFLWFVCDGFVSFSNDAWQSNGWVASKLIANVSIHRIRIFFSSSLFLMSQCQNEFNHKAHTFQYVQHYYAFTVRSVPPSIFHSKLCFPSLDKCDYWNPKTIFQLISQGTSHHRNARRATEVLANTRTFHFQREAQIRTSVIELLSSISSQHTTRAFVCLGRNVYEESARRTATDCTCGI